MEGIHGIQNRSKSPPVKAVVLKAAMGADTIVLLPRITRPLVHLDSVPVVAKLPIGARFEVHDFLVDPPCEFQCSRTARAGDLDISRAK